MRPGAWARSLVVLGDATDKAAVERMRAEVEEAFGGVEIYLGNAAPKPLYKNLFQTTDEDWLDCLNHRLDASWYLAEAFMPGMRDRGWSAALGPYGIAVNDVFPRLHHCRGDQRPRPRDLPGLTGERSAGIGAQQIPIRLKPTLRGDDRGRPGSIP